MLYSATDFLMALLCKQTGKVYLPCLRTKKYIMKLRDFFVIHFSVFYSTSQ